MRLPRPWLTIRRLMMAVVLVALVMGVYRLIEGEVRRSLSIYDRMGPRGLHKP